ncbi:MAG: NADH-quinone oxidoreductase subunit C [Euryarchaeota archaeon]|nr:NADH-quinone oxidoreductase subunit C [Euryarchaeota archaeon]
MPAYTDDVDPLKEAFGNDIVSDGDLSGKPVVYIHPDRALDVLSHAKKTLGFEHLSFVSCCDYPKEGILEMHWQLYSYSTGRHLVVKAHLDRDGAKRVASVTPLWTGANWHEREAWDLFGVRFDGHPDLKRIFLPDGWRGHPLLKDYDETEQFIGMDERGEDVVYDTPGPGRW